jgi:hypothetical protein
MNRLANSTGFTVMQPPNMFGEAAVRVLRDPTEDYSRNSFSHANKRDRKIRELVKKASIAYCVDSMVRQAVDKFSELFKAFDFDGGEEQVSYLTKRLIQMTVSTGEHWETLLTRIIHEYFKTGNAHIVKRRGGNVFSGKRPLYKNKPYTLSGLSLVSSDRLEVAKDVQGGFVGWEITGTKSDAELNLVLPSATRLNPDLAMVQVTNLPDKKNVLAPGMDIVHIAYKRGSDSNWGFGLTLAALEDISLRRSLELTTAVMMKKFSNPVIHHKVLRPSSPLAGMQQEINMAYEQWRRMAPDGVLITGGNAEVKAVGSESQALRVEGYLKYFMNLSLAGLGISPFLMGLEPGGQGTVESAVELMMMKVRFCQAEIAREIEMWIINEILWEGGFDPYNNPEDVVKLVFEDIDEDRIIKMQTHAADMFQKNMWGHSEARKIAGCKVDCPDDDLYLYKIDIPKTKAEAQSKGEAQKNAGVAIAKVRPKPAATAQNKRKAKEVLEIIENLVPQSQSQLNTFMNLLETRYGFNAEELHDLFEPITLLMGDDEAIKLLLVERLSDE